LLFGAEDRVELDDVRVRELRQMLDFANSVGRDSVFVLDVQLDLLDGDKARRIIAVVTAVDDGVGSFAETGACEALLALDQGKGGYGDVPWTYCRRTSSFICSARSVPPSPGVVVALMAEGLFALRRESGLALRFMVGFMIGFMFAI
jgi:hypothetical protein